MAINKSDDEKLLSPQTLKNDSTRCSNDEEESRSQKSANNLKRKGLKRLHQESMEDDEFSDGNVVWKKV